MESELLTNPFGFLLVQLFICLEFILILLKWSERIKNKILLVFCFIFLFLVAIFGNYGIYRVYQQLDKVYEILK